MICKRCGKEFIPGSPSAKYCSSDCRWEAGEERRIAAYEKVKANKKPREKQCRNCGKTFMQTGKELMCSEECRQEAKAKSVNRKYVRATDKEKVCPVCNKTFIGSTRKKYCSTECNVKAQLLRAKVVQKEKPCKVCGKVFMPGTAKAVYCSKQCSVKDYTRRKAIEEGRPVEMVYKPSHIDDRERYARSKGLHYADLQKRETIQMFARVELPEWTKGERI